MDAEIGCPKAFGLLKNGGAIAMFRYHNVPADGEKLYEDIQAVYKKHFHKPYIRPAKITKEEFAQPNGILSGFKFDDLKRYGFTDVTVKLYDVTRIFCADDYINILDTMLDHRSLPDSDRIALYAGVKDAILSHGGQINMDYVFQLYMGRKYD